MEIAAEDSALPTSKLPPSPSSTTTWCAPALFERIPSRVSQLVEAVFYRIGLKIAHNPYKCLGLSSAFLLFSLFGLYFFRQEKDPLKLWVPPDSDFVRDTRYLLTTVESALQMETLILTADDVLQPSVLLQLHNITERVVSAQSSMESNRISWTDVCFTVPSIATTPSRLKRQSSTQFDDDDFFDAEPAANINRTIFEPAVYLQPDFYCALLRHLPRACLLYSILDIWAFDQHAISRLTKEDIILQLDRTTTSPTLGHKVDYAALLGGVTRDNNGRIISAKALKTQWAVRLNFTNITTQQFGNNAGTADWATADILHWEAAFLKTLEMSATALRPTDRTATTNNLQIRYEAGRSFGDITQTNIFRDMDKLVLGIILMFLYVLFIISRANLIELRIWLTIGGLLCVGAAFLIAIGLCSFLRIPYGPVHASLPFMLLGLGIDDIFIIVASWKQVQKDPTHRTKSLQERIALMLAQAGSAICITSLTDVIAFLIGASTILPSLQSFCIYAAVGVLATFLLQITCFVAFFALDTKRLEAHGNAILPCMRPLDNHHRRRPSTSPPRRKLVQPFRRYSKILFSTSGKVLVLLLTLLGACLGITGSLQIQQWFDPDWFLPYDSYLTMYNEARSRYYSDIGYEAFVLIGPINYHAEFPKIMSLTENLRDFPAVFRIQPWPIHFAQFLATHFQIDLRNETLQRDHFHRHLSTFLFSRAGAKYQNNIQFANQLHCGRPAPNIRLATIAFQFKAFHAPHEWISAMDSTKRYAKDAGISGYVTVWSKIFGSWLTDKLIAGEVLRNLLLALLAVMTMTGLLVAQLQTCTWILVCVLLTILNVCGFMFFWGLTINIVSCIALELSVGLSIDYSAHVAHAYLHALPTKDGDGLDRKSRTEHALRHTGAAVAYGAGSTLLALSMMIFSDAYVFRSFFKIFFLVILFGLWHGLFFLPVVLSTIGPRSVRFHGKQRSTQDASSSILRSAHPLLHKQQDQRERREQEQERSS